MAAYRVNQASDVDWTDATDVVVVGFGGAGACAALEARANGASVLLIDRFGGGGTTKYSGGVIYAGNTRFQREAGFDDTVEDMLDYLKLEVGNVVKPETLRRYCETSAANVDWLIEHGVKYSGEAYLDKITYPPEGKFLYYSGNEKSPAFAEKAKPAPRGHRAVGPGFGGAHYIAALRKALAREKVDMMMHARVSRLVVDANDRVLGVEVFALPKQFHDQQQKWHESANPYVPHNHGKTERALAKMRALEEAHADRKLIRASGGVILAAGGYAYGRRFIEEHDAAFARHYDATHRLSTMGNDGGAIDMALDLGGTTGAMDMLYIARNIAPPEALLEGILVNRNGERFVTEDAYVSKIGGEIAKQPDGDAWMILSARLFRRSIWDSINCGWQRFKYFGAPILINYLLGGTKRAGSARGLARKIGIDPVQLERTIAQHDQDIARGAPDSVGKMQELRAKLGAGPYYAINMCMSNRHALTKFMTLGGLRVNEETGEAVRADGSPIKGLYAAGMTAVGLHSNGYISGLSIGDGVFSGRRAGAHAAHEAQGQSSGAEPVRAVTGIA